MKRKVFLALIALIAVLAFTACGGNNAGDPAPAPGQATPSPTPAAPNQPGAPDPTPVPAATDYRPIFGPLANEEHDFGGIDIVFFSPYGLGDAHQPGASPESDRFWQRVEFFQDRWNFNFEIRNVGWGHEMARYITTTLAGDPYGHFGRIISRDLFPSFITSGIAQELTQFNVFDQHPEVHPLLMESSEFDGGYYGIRQGFGFGWGGIHGNSTAIFFNITMLEREGQPTPFELYERGEWTWEAMLELANAVTRDLDGDGEIDQFGITGRHAGQAFMSSNAASTIWEEGGNFRFGLRDANALEAATFWGTVTSSPAWLGGGAWNAPFLNFRDGRVAMTIAQFWSRGNYSEANMSDEWGWVPIPMGPQGQDARFIMADEEAMWFMPSSAPNQWEAAMVMQALSTDIHFDPNDFLIIEEANVRNLATLQMYDHVMTTYNVRLDHFYSFGIGGILGGAFGRIAGGESASSVMEEIAPAVYANIEDRLHRDIAGNAMRQLAQAASQLRMAIFAHMITWEEVEDGDDIPHVSLTFERQVDGAYVTETWTIAEVEAQIAYAWEALNDGLAAGFTEEQIGNFGGFNNMRIVSEALPYLED